MRRASPAFLAEMQSFADDFTPLAVEHRDTPFKLRSGAESHWYVDTRHGVSHGSMLRRAAGLMLRHAIASELEFDVVAANGMGGRLFATSMVMVAAEYGNNSLSSAWLNDDRNDTDLFNGYGVYGARVEGRHALSADDISSSGSSQVTSINMLREAGATVTDALCLTDRSGGQAAEVLAAIDVKLDWLFEFHESDGLFRPAAHLTEGS